MFTIETPRLILTPTPLDVMKTRLERDDFVAAVPVAIDRDGQRVTEALRVHFPAEWPGPDALDAYPLWIAEREAQPERDAWGGIIVDRAALVAVGGMGFKGLPDETGAVELGYSVNASYQGRGYATEMAEALVPLAGSFSACSARYNVRDDSSKCLLNVRNHFQRRVLVAWTLRQPTVRRVTAECLEDNAASIRVLEKAGFVRVGHRMDDEGPLLLWERRP